MHRKITDDTLNLLQSLNDSKQLLLRQVTAIDNGNQDVIHTLDRQKLIDAHDTLQFLTTLIVNVDIKPFNERGGM